MRYELTEEIRTAAQVIVFEYDWQAVVDAVRRSHHPAGEYIVRQFTG